MEHINYKKVYFMLNCPLCLAQNNHAFHSDAQRHYLKCDTCELVFVAPSFLYSVPEEKAIYDQHENDPKDQNYRKHLNKLAAPLSEILMANSRGLDFGSGPGPTLSIMLSEWGHDMNIYDPIYADNKSLLTPSEPYDFITMTEVIEHIYNPHDDIAKLWATLKHGGILAIMTGLAGNHEHFKSWHYIKDPTHVCFYSKDTFEWLAQSLGAKLTFPTDNVVFLIK